MTRLRAVTRSLSRWWLPAWPVWLLLGFAVLPVVRAAPSAWLRAALAVPVLLAVPGSLTLAAAAGPRRRPAGPEFAGYAALLSLIWAVLVSLLLTLLGIPITTASTYWSLLMVCAALAIAAGLRLLAPPPPRRWAAPRSARSAAGYCATAVVAGAGLLAGAAYARTHLPRPAPAGYTWLAWAGRPVTGVIPVGRHGTGLRFEIVHRQRGTGRYRLTAVWQETPPRPLAGPLTFRVGPEQTFRGSLSVPPLPDGCTYRLTVTLSSLRQLDPLTRRPRTWSINADVRDQGRPAQGCRR